MNTLNISFFKKSLFGILFFLLSCYPAQDSNKNTKQDSPEITRITEKKPDPKKQKICQKRSKTSCEGSEKCENICDEVFKRRSAKKDCYKLPYDTVMEFESLISATEDGEIEEIEEIGYEVLECMLDIEERGFAEAVEEMKRSEIEEFFAFIADSEGFAEVLEDEDDEFNVLKQLLNNLKGSDLTTYLSQEVRVDGDDKSLLLLASEYNESLWKWLDNYVDEICNKGDSAECPGGENIGTYCKALINSYSRERDWEDFLKNADIFAKEYEDDVEDQGYDYEITDDPRKVYEEKGDFRNYCVMKTSGLAPSVCPVGTNRDKSSQTLGTFTFEAVPVGGHAYFHNNYRTAENDNPDDKGTSDPSSQSDVLAIKLQRDDGGYRLVRVVLVSQGTAEGPVRYHFYLGDQRVELITGNSGSFAYTQSGVSHRVFTLPLNTEGPLYTDSDLNRASVWLTEEQDGECNSYIN